MSLRNVFCFLAFVLLMGCNNGYQFSTAVDRQGRGLETCDKGPAPLVNGLLHVSVQQNVVLSFNASETVWSVQTEDGMREVNGKEFEHVYSRTGQYAGGVRGRDACQNLHAYQFTISVGDVPPPPPPKPRVPVVDNFFIDSLGNKLDIVVVVDNSPSMWEEQEKMAQRFSSFISRLSHLDWQLGIITTDAGKDNKVWRGGQLVPFAGLTNVYSVNSRTPDVEAIFGKTIRRRETGTSTEEGIRSLRKMLNRNDTQFFFRPNAHLASIIVSDEDERSSGRGLKEENRPENLISSLEHKFRGEKTYSNHSVVLMPDREMCPQAGDAYHGRTYIELSRLTGGIVGDLCASDYGDILKSIGDSIADKTYSALLKCEPAGDIEVKLSPQPADRISHLLTGKRLVLEPHPPVGTRVEVTYYCN